MESDFNLYIEQITEVFRDVRRVLRDDGTLWLNLGDSYAGSWGAQSREHAGKHAPNVSALSANQVKAAQIRTNNTGSLSRTPLLKAKDLVGIPWRVAFALQADGWYLRQDIIWSKPNPMPESVRDRCTKAHEYLFLLSKSERYYYDAEAIKEPAAYDPQKTKFPDGWDTGAGGHGSFHRSGREKGRASGNKTHKSVTEYEGSESEEHRTKAGLLKISATPYATRNKRSVWTIAPFPFKEAHFATFPPALVEPCLRAGTSEYGCCPKCGAPWKRLTETEYRHHEKWFGDKQGARHSRGKAGTSYDEPISTKITGWTPTCKCEAVGCPTRGIVLDPFGGAGTVGLVAKRLNRHAVLIELNPDYAAMAQRRIDAEPFPTAPMPGINPAHSQPLPEL